MISPKHVVSLLMVVSALWLVLSGHVEPLLLFLGAVSAAATVWVALRMEIIDHESYPLELTPQLWRYWGWLLWQIVLANIAVARRVLGPLDKLTPVVTRVSTGHRTPIGLCIYANSITLTPGTVSLNVEEDAIEVHALTQDGARELQEGDMGRRVPDPGLPS